MNAQLLQRNSKRRLVVVITDFTRSKNSATNMHELQRISRLSWGNDTCACCYRRQHKRQIILTSVSDSAKLTIFAPRPDLYHMRTSVYVPCY